MNLTIEQVTALAPDASSAAAAKKLATPAAWRGLGQSAAALWGECQGTALYQVRVALADLTAKCSCPSRKLPCKHSLGLLLLLAATRPPSPNATRPIGCSSGLPSAPSAPRRKRNARPPLRRLPTPPLKPAAPADAS